jgi:hypothetical protein
VLHTANHEGELEHVTPSGLRFLSVTGWAHDLDSPTPLQVEILVNGATRTTVTADRPREGEPANGFAARIVAPTQPALVCARTVAAPPDAGLVVGCKRLAFRVPIAVVGAPDQPPPSGQFAEFFWIDPQGEIAKELGSAPVENGVAVYDGDPLPEPLSWAVVVRDPGELPLFRSGPLERLPGPAGSIAGATAIAVFRNVTGANFGLHSLEGAPQLVTERLQQLPSSVRVEDVRLTVPDADHEVVLVRGRIRRFLVFAEFNYRLALTIRPATAPGRHAQDILIVEAAGPGSASGASLGSIRPQLDLAIVEGVKDALEFGVKFVASTQAQVGGATFPAALVSVTRLELVPHFSQPSVSVFAHAGAVTGDVTTGGILVADEPSDAEVAVSSEADDDTAE